MSDFVLQPKGPFNLSSSARFIAGWPPAVRAYAPEAVEGVLRLAFLVDDWSGHAGVVLAQAHEDGPVTGSVVESTAADIGRVRDQAARIVSLDHDGRGYAAIGDQDPMVGELQRESGWLRPVLFHSPYEAACWAVLSARIRQSQAAELRGRVSRAHGGLLRIDGAELATFPAPEHLLRVSDVPGLPAEKVRRLHGIAEAALAGRLDRERLLALDHEQAVAELQELRGIGPFWAWGILLRAVGTTDALPLGEERVRRAAAERYAMPDVVEDDEAFVALAERWRPFRTWVAVLLRATA